MKQSRAIVASLAADVAEIAEIIRECDYERCDEPGYAALRADFSLHIQPNDLNILSRLLAEFNGQDPTDLRPHLTLPRSAHIPIADRPILS